MADRRGARGAATRNGGKGAGTVELDGTEDPMIRLSRVDETIETNNIYGGRTDKTTFKQLDGGTYKVIREVVVKYDKERVVCERVEKFYNDRVVTELVSKKGGVDTKRVYKLA